MTRIHNAIKKYLFNDTGYFFLYCYRYLFDKDNGALYYGDNELMDLVNNGKSIIRIGDGEIGLLHRLEIHYQKYSDSIRADFLRIIKRYNDNSKYIIGIPLFVNYSNAKLKKMSQASVHDYFSCWMPLKITYEMIFNKKMKYFDAHTFYRDTAIKEKLFSYAFSKKVILVTNQENEFIIKKSRISNQIYHFIISPAENSYEKREKIKNAIVETIDGSNCKKEDFIILMSSGLSKTIIYELSNMGYQLFDIGKGLEGYCSNKSLEYLI